LNLEIITPDWPAPPNVRAAVSTRIGGVSRSPYDGLNLGDHVGDDPQAVAANRRLLREFLHLPGEPHWLQQVHGTCAVDAGVSPQGCEADAVFSHAVGKVCAVLTADCLPVLLCDTDGTTVAAVHAGWRGLLDGVIEQTVERMAVPGPLLAWLGPAIGPMVFEVGEEVREAFVHAQPSAAEAFVPSPNDRWLADIYALAKLRLERCGVTDVSGGDFCTFSDRRRFYSYRRDGQTGRMASLIWLEPSPG
jgi:YfiH family protein